MGPASPLSREPFLTVAELSVGHERAQDIENHAASELCGVVIHIIGRRYFHDLHAA